VAKEGISRIDLGEKDPRTAYHWLTRTVAPRPIAWVSTKSPRGKLNLAPFSYFNAGGANPPSLVFSCTYTREGKPKDTLRNVRETGEFVVNVVTREVVEAANLTSRAFEYEVSEFEEVGLTPAWDTAHVTVPRVAESPIAFECRVFAIVDHGNGPLSAHYVIGEVLAVHCDASLLDEEGMPDPAKIEHCARLGKSFYLRVREEELFELPRP